MAIYYYFTILGSGQVTLLCKIVIVGLLCLSLDDVISVVDSMVLILHLCGYFFYSKFYYRTYEFSTRVKGSLHKGFLLQKYKMFIAKH